MKRVFLFFVLCLLSCVSANSQKSASCDKKAERRMEQADKYIEDFKAEKLDKYYSIYNIGIKRKYEDIQFNDTIVPPNEILFPFLDFKKVFLNDIIVSMGGHIWNIHGMYENKRDFCYSKDLPIDKELFMMLDDIKPERIYYLFGLEDVVLLVKEGNTFLYGNMEGRYVRCELSDIMDAETFSFLSKKATSNRLVFVK